jgi:hypothetical protein
VGREETGTVGTEETGDTGDRGPEEDGCYQRVPMLLCALYIQLQQGKMGGNSGV